MRGSGGTAPVSLFFSLFLSMFLHFLPFLPPLSFAHKLLLQEIVNKYDQLILTSAN